MTPENLEGLCRAIIAKDKGNTEFWRGIAKLLRTYVEVAERFLSPATFAELTTLFSHEIGEGPSDPDPDF